MKISPPDSVIAALRQATADRHRSIESLLALDAGMDLARYRAVLAGFHLFLSGWEPVVGRALGADAAWFFSRSRLPLLRQDLAILGIVPRTDVLPLLASLHVEEAAGAWGALYVVEGSALGGQVISRAIATQLGVAPDSGGRYFAGWGERCGPMWSEFKHRLEQSVGREPRAVDQACRGAMDTFDALMEVFSTDDARVA